MDNNNTVIQEFFNSIEQMLALPDELINETTLAMLKGAIQDAIYEQGGREKAINDIAYEMKISGNAPESYVSSLRDFFEAYIEELETTDLKKAYVQTIFNTIMELLNEAAVSVQNESKEDTVIYYNFCKENAKLPTYATDGSAGMDIYCPEDVTVPARARGMIIPTGLKAAIPEGWMLSIRPRSGMTVKTPIRIANAPGTIDSDFRDEIGVIVDNMSTKPYEIHAGDRIAQFVFEKVYHAENTLTDTPIETIGKNRGGGFGSTGA